ncbi:hypothetical protein K443DRAFT_341203 [Laccaria amethystina LaAM-08-1]|uniref:Uncharacterized protein n=1 Tax=Laccaria amethystina LaAM-08-1 TaxID=1095629 RepID=A0A0C9WT00_9AGAR|nr:hypothetical protein K443DRAFT_341203 [Laccaria amethystina LaAM-08-1]
MRRGMFSLSFSFYSAFIGDFQRNCNSAKVCVEPPETPLRVAPWQWGLTMGSILAAMIVICILLTLIHRRHRYARYKELQEYYPRTSVVCVGRLLRCIQQLRIGTTMSNAIVHAAFCIGS